MKKNEKNKNNSSDNSKNNNKNQNGGLGRMFMHDGANNGSQDESPLQTKQQIRKMFLFFFEIDQENCAKFKILWKISLLLSLNFMLEQGFVQRGPKLTNVFLKGKFVLFLLSP